MLGNCKIRLHYSLYEHNKSNTRDHDHVSAATAAPPSSRSSSSSRKVEKDFPFASEARGVFAKSPFKLSESNVIVDRRCLVRGVSGVLGEGDTAAELRGESKRATKLFLFMRIGEVPAAPPGVRGTAFDWRRPKLKKDLRRGSGDAGEGPSPLARRGVEGERPSLNVAPRSSSGCTKLARRFREARRRSSKLGFAAAISTTSSSSSSSSSRSKNFGFGFAKLACSISRASGDSRPAAPGELRASHSSAAATTMTVSLDI